MQKQTFFSYLLLILALTASAISASAQEVGVIKLLNIRGIVTVDGTPASGSSMDVRVGQEIETGSQGSAILFFSNGSSLSLSKETKITVDQFRQSSHNAMDLSKLAAEPSTSNTQVSLEFGEIIGDVKKLNNAAGSSFDVQTPVGIAGIRGTTFIIQLLLNSLTSNIEFYFACNTGEVTFTPAGQAMANVISILSGRAIEVKLEGGQVVVGGVEAMSPTVQRRVNAIVSRINAAIASAYGGTSQNPGFGPTPGSEFEDARDQGVEPGGTGGSDSGKPARDSNSPIGAGIPQQEGSDNTPDDGVSADLGLGTEN